MEMAVSLAEILTMSADATSSGLSFYCSAAATTATAIAAAVAANYSAHFFSSCLKSTL